MLAQNTSERRIIIWAGAITLSVCLSAIVGSLCWLVIRDGNTALVADVTGKLTLVAIGGMAGLVAALFGQNTVLNKIVDKVA